MMVGEGQDGRHTQKTQLAGQQQSWVSTSNYNILKKPMQEAELQETLPNDVRKKPSDPAKDRARDPTKDYLAKWNDSFFAQRDKFRRWTAQKRQKEIELVKKMQAVFPENKKISILCARMEYEEGLIKQFQRQQKNCKAELQWKWRQLKACDSYAYCSIFLISLVAILIVTFFAHGGLATYDFLQQPDYLNQTAAMHTGDTAENTSARNGNLTSVCNISAQLSLVRIAAEQGIEATVDCTRNSAGSLQIRVLPSLVSESLRQYIANTSTTIIVLLVTFWYFFSTTIKRKLVECWEKLKQCCSCLKSDNLQRDLDESMSNQQKGNKIEMNSGSGLKKLQIQNM